MPFKFVRSHIGKCVALSISTIILVLPSSAQADVLVQSTFDSNSEGWTGINLDNALGNPPTVLGNFAETYNATGGNPGGFVGITDPDGSWAWFAAPAAFLGDKSGAYGGTITYDTQSTGSDGNNYPAIALVGNGQAIYYPAAPPAQTWSSYNIPLTPTGWKVGDYQNGAEPTAAEMQNILGNLSGLYVEADWQSVVDTTGLDNFAISAVPEPGHLALLALASFGLVRRRLQR